MNEPPHLHETKNKKGYQSSPKIWLESLVFAETGSLTNKELNTIAKIVKNNQQVLLNTISSIKRGEDVEVIQLTK